MAALSTVVADNSAPFWIHSLTMGQISKEPYSGNLSAAIYKPSTRPHRWYDYDFGIVLSAHTDTKYTTAYFQSLYAHARLYIVDFTVGITPLITGSQNPQLTTGGLLFSGNAHSIPRISIGIDQYTPVPGLYGYLEVKGGVTHGWMADNMSASRRLMTFSLRTREYMLHRQQRPSRHLTTQA